MLKLFVLVIKLNFIVTLSRCYCTSSDSPGLDFIIETVYESLGLCHYTSLSYNSLLPSQSTGPERGEEEENEGEREEHKNGYDKRKHTTICHADLQVNKHNNHDINTTRQIHMRKGCWTSVLCKKHISKELKTKVENTNDISREIRQKWGGLQAWTMRKLVVIQVGFKISCYVNNILLLIHLWILTRYHLHFSVGQLCCCQHRIHFWISILGLWPGRREKRFEKHEWRT